MTFDELVEKVRQYPNCSVEIEEAKVCDIHHYVNCAKARVKEVLDAGNNPNKDFKSVEFKRFLTEILSVLEANDQSNIKKVRNFNMKYVSY